MDISEMDVELQATCSALGYVEGTEYVKEPDCIETIKDLIRFLRRDTDICDIRRQLGKAQILQNDLIPLVKTYHEDTDLFDTALKLLVNLTQPVLACFNNEIPDEKTLRNNCLEVEGYLQDYKESFIDEDLFSVLASKIQDILKMDWEERREDDRLLLERMLVLVRNILMVPADTKREQRTEDDASTHDKVLWMVHMSGLEDMILYVASSDRERSSLCMHVLEIIALIFKEQEPETLASAGVQRSLTEKEKDQRELEQAREREKIQKKANILKYSARHSRFGGTFVLKDVKSISDSDVIYHKPLCEVKSFTYDVGKQRKKISKNRAPIKTDDLKRRSTLSMRLSLKEFCVQFLINAYNPLMREVKSALTRKSTQDNDESYYLWAMRFFTEFCRLHCKRVDLVSETMSMPSFHYIYTQLATYYETIRMEKGEQCKVWGRRVHLALKAYQELLRTLDFMSRFPDEQIKESAKVIQSNVFYMSEFRDVFVTLLKYFKENVCSRAYLRDLVESTHLFLKMLETFTKSNKNLVVQSKKKKKSGRSKKKNKNAAPEESVAEPTQEELDTIWGENISEAVTACLEGQGEIPEDVAPFDAASEVDMDEQRVEAMLRIQSTLRDGRAGEAIALFRAAREVWPDNDQFGTADMSVEEEFLALREVFMASLPRPQTMQQTNEEEEGGDLPDELGDENEEMEVMQHSETHFDFNGFINSFAHIDVVKAYVILLREFSHNSDSVNHCVVKMLHRLSHDFGYVGMLFQASVFVSFNNLLNGPYARIPRFKELSKFAHYVVRQFTQIAQVNKKIFVDMLFWKSKNEALAITMGYDFTAKHKTKKAVWSDHQEEELRGLWEKFKDLGTKEKDAADLILEELTSDHTRMHVLKELKRQELIKSVKDLKQPGSARGWEEQDVQELRDLFESCKDSKYPITDIIMAMTKKRSRHVVIRKLQQLGLVPEKGESKKKRKSRGNDEDDDEEADSSDSGSSAEEEDNDGVDNGDTTTSTVRSIGDHMVKILEQGYEEQIAWIIRGLRNAAEDRDEGICTPTPIVPLSEENETAMEDESFLNFLRAIGISAPASEQELFWRIPGYFTSRDLNTMADCLTVTESREATDPEEVQRIVARVLPELAASQSSAGTSMKNGRKKKKKDSKKKKEKKTRKKKPFQARVKKSTESGQVDDIGADEGSENEDDGDESVFVPHIPRGQHSTDTSDSGLDSELEAKEQLRLWKEKKGQKKGKVTAADRKEALTRMMERRNMKHGRVAPGKEKITSTSAGTKDNSDSADEPVGVAAACVTENDADAVATEARVTENGTDAGDGMSETGAAGNPQASPASSKKKRTLKAPASSSDSSTDISSLSSMSEAEDDGGDDAKQSSKAKKKKSSSTKPAKSLPKSVSKKRLLTSDSDSDAPLTIDDGGDDTKQASKAKTKNSSSTKPAKSLPKSVSKKRLLTSDSDSDAPLTIDIKQKQKKKRKSSDADLNLSPDDDVALQQENDADQPEGSDKENKHSDSQSQLDESLRLHFSCSDEEDDEKDGEEKKSSDLEEDSVLTKKRESANTESFPATMLTQGVDSDDEDDHITLKSAAKRRRAVIEDSDDD